MPCQPWRLSKPLFLLLLPCLAGASSIEVNNMCVSGTCPVVAGSDPLQLNQSTGSQSGFTLLTVGLDNYRVDWTYSAFYDAQGTHLSVNPTVTYIGAGLSQSDDDIIFKYTQNFDNPTPGVWDGTYTENVPLFLSMDAGSASTVSAELFYDGHSVGLVGPYGPGTYLEQHSVTLSGVMNPLSAVFTFDFHFEHGAATDSHGASPAADGTAVPEPAQTLPAGIALLGGIWQLAIRRRKAQ